MTCHSITDVLLVFPTQQHGRTKKGHVETFAINPKCVKLGELYGETNPNTFEWTDGLIAMATRRFARELSAITSQEDTHRTQAGSSASNAVSIHQ